MQLFSKEATLEAGKFMLLIIAIFLAISFLLTFIPLGEVELFYANSALVILKAFGFSGETFPGEPAVLVLDKINDKIGFGYLCTALLEMAIIISALLATAPTPLEKRVKGALLAVPVLAIFNLARIVASILIIAYFGLEAGNFSHDIFFRVFLFFAIAEYYYLWFGKVMKKT